MERSEKILEAVACGAIAFLRNGKGFDEIASLYLEHLGLAAGMERAYIFQNSVHPELGITMSQKYEWVLPGIPSQVDNPDLQNLPYFPDLADVYDSLNRKLCWSASQLDDVLNPTSRKLLAAQAIQSICLFPILVNDSFWGFIGFDLVTKSCRWTSLERNALLASAAVIGAAIEKYQHIEELKAPVMVLKGVEHELRSVMSEHLSTLSDVRKDIQRQIKKRQG